MKIPQKDIETLAKKLHKPLVVFDLETTSANAKTTETVQFYAIRIEPSGKTSELHFICKPGCTIEKGASEVHGIYEKDVLEKKPFSDYAKKIAELFKGCVISGYNSNRFDVEIIKRQLEESGIKEPAKTWEFYDAYPVYMGHSKRKLRDCLLYYTGEDLENAHDASYDVSGTVRIIAAQLVKDNLNMKEAVEKLASSSAEKDKDISRWFYSENGKWYINFTKHKGCSLCSLDQGMLNWLIEKTDLSTECKKLIGNYVKKKI